MPLFLPEQEEYNTMSWNKDEALVTLSYPGGFLPQDGLEEALYHYDDIKAELYAAIRLAPDEVKTLEALHNKEYSLKFFAIYLAAEKCDGDAFAPMHEYFSTCGADAWKPLGKMTGGNLADALRAICRGDIKVEKDEVCFDGMDGYAHIAFCDALDVRGNRR